jgi:hypothetical protein
MSLKAKWQDWFDKTTEECFVQFEGDRIRAEGVIRGTNPEFRVQYRITLNSEWEFREAEIQSKDAKDEGKQIFIASDGKGKWTDYKNQRLEGLEEAVDVDFILTPFTNSLPVKRLQLPRGESADITVASIAFPSLTLTPDQQRYTCIEPNRLYRFDSLTSDFTQDIAFDEEGLVADYPQMFKRIK